MATGQVSAGYSLGATAKVRHNWPTPSSKKVIRRRKTMKQTLKSRLRNWLFDEEKEADAGIYVEEDKLQSDGIRLQVYKASGGYVVETRGYDSKTDRNRTSLHVVKDEEDLGNALGKIVMMEALQL